MPAAVISFLRQKVWNLTSDKRFSEILTGSAYALAARVAATGLGLLSSIIVARYYGANALGILAMVNSFLMLITIFTVMGTGTSILRLIPEHITKYSVTSAFRVYRKTQYLVATVSVLTGAAFFFSAGIVADRVFHKPHLTFLFSLAAAFVVFKSLMDLNTQAVRGLRLMRTFAVMQVLPSVTMLSVLAVVTFSFRDPNNPVYAQLAAIGVTAVVGAWVMGKAFTQRMGAGDAIEQESVRNIFFISMPMLMTATMNYFIAQTGILILGIFRSESDVGYYTIAVKIATLTTVALEAINSMAAPKFSELFHSGKIDDLFYVAKKSAKLIFWVTTPILIMLIIMGKPLLSNIYGREFVVAYPAMMLLILGQFINSVSGSTGYFLSMTGRHIALRNITLGATLINISLSVLLIPMIGVLGAAIAAMLSVSFKNIVALVYINSKHGQTTGYIPLLIK